MTNKLERQVAQFHEWRAGMIRGIEAYKGWLDANGYADIQQSLRMYDLVESLKYDRMTLAFIAEFSRGKTELINALFFADFKQRLLPSGVGRTTMCPTEIFHDPDDEPYLRLLPIETRKRAESIALLKSKPVEWIKVRLDPSSTAQMVQSMQTLTETKTVTVEEAEALGLMDKAAPETNTVVLREDGRVEVPSWRHALINFPHPLLKSGVTVLDTPGLNALGTEPELTMSMIPSAHAVLFLLAMDTGVTRSDLDIWQKYIDKRVGRKLAVLNKVDLMWDELKPEPQIGADVERQLDATAHQLGLPRTHVLAISAQKALIGRVKEDPALLAKSGIAALEALLANEIIPAKQEILRQAVAREIGAMVDGSRQAVIGQYLANRDELAQLTGLAGKNKGVAQAMVVRLETDRANFQQSVQQFRAAAERLTAQGKDLLANLDEATIAELLGRDREFIEGAWTTAGLLKSMQGLFGHFTSQSAKILNFSNDIKKFVDDTYAHFHAGFGFAPLAAPPLNLEKHTLDMALLQETARQFCRDPVNMATYKHFVVNRFYDTLVERARQILEATRADSEAWLKAALNPLSMQLKEHETVLARRVENLKKIRDSVVSLSDRIKHLERTQATLKEQAEVLTRIKSDLDGRPATGPQVPQAQAA
ncbi:MAG TPA: dynamin family protein [Burkholderiales bacterium]|nr:dynamin family protein [Burkholderiales bacterium]